MGIIAGIAALFVAINLAVFMPKKESEETSSSSLSSADRIFGKMMVRYMGLSPFKVPEQDRITLATDAASRGLKIQAVKIVKRQPFSEADKNVVLSYLKSRAK